MAENHGPCQQLGAACIIFHKARKVVTRITALANKKFIEMYVCQRSVRHGAQALRRRVAQYNIFQD